MLILVNEYLGESGSGTGSAKLYYYIRCLKNGPPFGDSMIMPIVGAPFSESI